MNGLPSRFQLDVPHCSARRAVMLAAASLPALAWIPAVFGQAKKPPIVIGWLGMGSAETFAQNVAAFKEGLAALGWKEGAQFVLETRMAEGQRDRLPALADELAKRKPAVIITGASFVSNQLVKAAPDTPIVQAGGAAVQAGLAKTLAQPGGMVTGITAIPTELSEKLFELLVEVAPKARRVGVLLDGNFSDRAAWIDGPRRAAARYSLELYFAYPAKAEAMDAAIADLAKQGAQALVALTSPLLHFHRSRIIVLAQAQRWPIVSWHRLWVEQGALISYGFDSVQTYRRAAYFVDRILKGAKPADLPIEQPMTFELAVNMQSAKALGLTIPPTIMVRATHVIG